MFPPCWRAGSTVERWSWPRPCSWIRRTPARGPMSFQISGYLPILSRLGKLDQSHSQHGTQKYNNVFIDEAHRYRTESNVTYEKIAQICRGKRVVLVTATPFNNSPKDILSQIKLFQNAKKSTIPNVSNLERILRYTREKAQAIRQANRPRRIHANRQGKRAQDSHVHFEVPDGQKNKKRNRRLLCRRPEQSKSQLPGGGRPRTPVLPVERGRK